MPEIPDLEAIRGFYNARIIGHEITSADALIPYVVRTGAADFVASMTGNRFGETLRRGKFLLFGMGDGQVTVFILTLDNGMQVRYADQRLMGKIYLVPPDGIMSVPMFAEMGPDALEVTEDEFRARIRKHAGAIKNILTNHKFVAGIGNAYSDEILFEARIDPFRKRTTMSDDDIGRLYRGMRAVYDWANPLLAEHFRDELDYHEWREHLKVHRKGAPEGAPRDEGRCPRCGTHLTQISPNDRVTTWCRTCQT
jgi:formamidopyrimidine-DNA glycosylase